MRSETGKGKEKMIHFTCDLCKIAEVKDHRVLTYRKQHEAGIMWDVCDACLEKVKEQLGEGREMPQWPPAAIATGGRKLR